MKKLLVAACLGLCLLLVQKASAQKEFRVCWSHYTGWEPWGYIQDSGIMKRWADKYGISVKVERINDYVESINLYTAGKYQGCAMTNMDALSIPAAGGVDSTALIVGDFSNGNDGIVLRNGTALKDLKGKDVLLVKFSVSHYLLSRALTLNGMAEKDLKLINTSDADIGSVFLSNPNAAAVTWNPILLQLRNAKGVNMVFDSSKVPGEIMDLMVVKSDAPPELKKALVGAWFEAMGLMNGGGKTEEEMHSAMAKESGGTLAEFRAQLKTTAMYYSPKEAVDFAKSPRLKENMEYVRTFLFNNGLLGEGATSKDYVGIEFPDKVVLGNPKNVKLRFDTEYMTMAQDKKL